MNNHLNFTGASNSSFTTSEKSGWEPNYVSITHYTVTATICVIGILGNILVIIVTSTKRSSKTAVHKYIFNLAVADIGVLAICYPLIFVKAADPFNWPLGKVVCKVVYPFSDIFYSASIGSIVAIAIDRHTAIVRGMTAHRSLSVAKWVILGVWLSGFIAVVTPLYFVMAYIEKNGTIDCTSVWPSTVAENSYIVSLSILWYILPLGLILWAYRQIASKIRASKMLHSRITGMCGTREANTMKRTDAANTKALKMPVVIAFAVTMFPFHAFRLASLFVRAGRWRYLRIGYNICIVLLSSNSAVNPIIYSLISREFRQRFKDVFRFKLCRLFRVPSRRNLPAPAGKQICNGVSGLELTACRQFYFSSENLCSRPQHLIL
ncbi:Somatostatin receptor type 4 [Acropora cervicornis]|uniref:Somatostatin receptor type 4 n=1 Tax=Acropora cervicornis TaxID=6130 RepID=A0AAD9R2K3_ACRCE|nr:Somatostatin receptor type 4 [Acropora cervicornis]